MENEDRKREYVLNDVGKIYIGSHSKPKGRKWYYGQVCLSHLVANYTHKQIVILKSHFFVYFFDATIIQAKTGLIKTGLFTRKNECQTDRQTDRVVEEDAAEDVKLPEF